MCTCGNNLLEILHPLCYTLLCYTKRRWYDFQIPSQFTHSARTLPQCGHLPWSASVGCVGPGMSPPRACPELGPRSASSRDEPQEHDKATEIPSSFTQVGIRQSFRPKSMLGSGWTFGHVCMAALGQAMCWQCCFPTCSEHWVQTHKELQPQSLLGADQGTRHSLPPH